MASAARRFLRDIEKVSAKNLFFEFVEFLIANTVHKTLVKLVNTAKSPLSSSQSNCGKRGTEPGGPCVKAVPNHSEAVAKTANSKRCSILMFFGLMPRVGHK